MLFSSINWPGWHQYSAMAKWQQALGSDRVKIWSHIRQCKNMETTILLSRKLFYQLTTIEEE